MNRDTITPDPGGPHPFRRVVTAVEPLANLRTAQVATLECGHTVMVFGSLSLAPAGVICDQCMAEAKAKG